MTILALRTDREEAELAIYKDAKMVAEEKWTAGRELTDTIHAKLDKLLNKSSIKLSNLEGIVCFAGPGSFTGLRIGLSVANALAYAQSIPIVSTNGDRWLEKGLKRLTAGQNDKVAIPKYLHPAITTLPKK